MATRKMMATAAELQFGQSGSIFTNTNTQVVAPTGKVIVAIQMISDTTFDELTPHKSFNDFPNGICVGGTAGETALGSAAASSETKYLGSGGQVINVGASSTLTKFPRGMIIYGRWDSFTIDADPLGGVIAYLG